MQLILLGVGSDIEGLNMGVKLNWPCFGPSHTDILGDLGDDTINVVAVPIKEESGALPSAALDEIALSGSP